MKIAYVPSLYDQNMTDATNITLTLLSKEVKTKNEYVGIFSQRENNALHEKINGVEIYRTSNLPAGPKNIFDIFGAANSFFKDIFDQPSILKKIIKQKNIKFDIIHGFSASPLMSLRTLLCKPFSSKSKLIHTIKGNTKYWFSNIFTFLLNFFDAVIVPTHTLKKKLSRFGCSPGKVIVIRSPIDLEKFKPQNKAELKKKYHYEGKVVLYYGHLSEVKGISHLIEAAKYLDDDVTVLFVTPSVKKFYLPYIRKISAEHMQNKIKVITKKVKIEEYVNMADVVVLPYPNLISTEGNPLCLLESMACKTPVVTTDIKELKEIVSPNHDVLMAEPKNSKNIAENIMKLLNDVSLQKRLAENAYKKSKEFDIKKIGKKHIELYKRIAK